MDFMVRGNGAMHWKDGLGSIGDEVRLAIGKS